MKNKERLNLMLERLDRIDRILDEKLESSCREEDIDDLESVDEGILDAVKGLVGKSSLKDQSAALAKKITSNLGTVTLRGEKNATPLKNLIQVNPREEKILKLQGMGCAIRAKNKEDDKLTAYIYTPKNKPSYIFISDGDKKKFIQEIDLNNPGKIADYLKKNLSNFTNIKAK